ncbi:MAG: hypothetical protein ACJAT4_001460 [Granulosicoccus sp.]|jgi:hypothetical protein
MKSRLEKIHSIIKIILNKCTGIGLPPTVWTERGVIKYFKIIEEPAYAQNGNKK